MTNVMIYDAHVRIGHDPTSIDNFYQQTLEFLESKYHNYPTHLSKHIPGDGILEGDGFVSGKHTGSTPIGKLVV